MSLHVTCGNPVYSKIDDGRSCSSEYNSSLSEQPNRAGLTKPAEKSYSREYKLFVVDLWRVHKKNIYRTAQQFLIDRKMLQPWVKDEEKIKASTKGTRKNLRYIQCHSKLIVAMPFLAIAVSISPIAGAQNSLLT